MAFLSENPALASFTAPQKGHFDVRLAALMVEQLQQFVNPMHTGFLLKTGKARYMAWNFSRGAVNAKTSPPDLAVA